MCSRYSASKRPQSPAFQVDAMAMHPEETAALKVRGGHEVRDRELLTENLITVSAQ